MTWQVLYFDTLTSTQDWLKDHYQDLDDSVCVVAQQQSAGRGREDRLWCSEPGGLYVSLLLKPERLRPDLPWLIWAACIRVLEHLGAVRLTLKAPNDILYQGKKLAGSLIDAAVQGGKPRYYICGLGVNLNQTAFPDTLAAISLSQVLGRRVDPDLVLEAYLSAFDDYYRSSDEQRMQKIGLELRNRQIQIGYNTPRYVDFEEYWNVSRR